MLQKMVRSFNPDLSRDEARKFGLLGITFFIIIGAYWLLRLLKDTIFFTIAFPEKLGWAVGQGKNFQPSAKMWSFLVLFILVLVYSKLVDSVKKQQLFYILCSVYSLLFAGIGLVLFFEKVYGAEYVGRDLLAITGWASFFVIESFGSLIVSLFWAFTNSITDPAAAKRGFPIIVMMAQVGAIIGSAIPFFAEDIGSLWPILMVTAVVILMVIPMVHYFMKTTPQDQLVGYKNAAKIENNKKEGFMKSLFSGLTLLFTRPYLLGVFVISTFYEAVGAIMDYEMKSMASVTKEWGSSLLFAKFTSIFGVTLNSLALVITLLGTGYIIKRFGIRISIMIYPVAVGIVLIGIYMYGAFADHTPTQLLWATFAAMVIVKGFGYAVNNPTKEMMYIPTSKDVKFKTKGFIDTVGARGAKAGGSKVNDIFKNNLQELMFYGTIFGLGLIAVWAVAAFIVGKKNVKLVENGEVIS